jgi:hypothetical protein
MDKWNQMIGTVWMTRTGMIKVDIGPNIQTRNFSKLLKRMNPQEQAK